MKKKILVVGGTGFIGFHLIKKLKNKKFIVDSISTKQPPKKRTISGVKYILSDVSNLAKLKKSIKEDSYSHVINLAGHVDNHNKKSVFVAGNIT